MMRDDGMDDPGRFAETACNLTTDNGMWPLNLLVDRFAHIMQERSGFTNIDVCPQFMGHCSCKNGDLNGVCQHVLPIAGAEMKSSQNPEEFWLKTMHIGFQSGIF